MTAPMTTASAEVGQSPNVTTDIISDYGENFNPSAEEMFEAQMQYEQEMQAQAQAELTTKALTEFVQSFQKRNPQLRVFNAVIHLDEETPHVHLDFIPFATGQKRGLSTRN